MATDASGSRDDMTDVIAPLPTVVPLFPLTGALLLPRSIMPLNIFEPRYLAMVRDALDRDHVIGMVQPQDPDDTRFEPPIYKIACLGRITEHRNLPDGRMMISLEGISRFDIVEELAHTTPYRQARVDYDRFTADIDAIDHIAVADRDSLIGHLRKFLATRNMSADWSLIDTASDEMLVNALATICPFEANEKQALLEASSLTDRARLMITMMDFALADTGDTPSVPH